MFMVKFPWLSFMFKFPYGMYSNSTVVLKADSVYKQAENYHPQVYVEECTHTDAESQQCNTLIDSDENGVFEV